MSEDLKEIVSSTIESIREGIKGKGCGVAGTIKFELSVVKGKNEKGGIRFYIAEVGGNYSSEIISKIKFEIGATKVHRGPDIPFLWLTESPTSP
jgi:hypothetical protein